jgi:CheY-like chemotaxis protein
VLVADDYPGLISALARLLSHSCDVVGHVADGIDLLDAVGRHRPDVVVVDVHLPGINGLEACRRIRELPLPPAVVVISAATDAAIRERALAVGASAFVTKYELANRLEAAVQQAFGETSVSDGPDPPVA